MFSTRIYLKIVFQVALILLVTGVGLTGIITGKAIILGCVTLLIALWLVGILVYFLAVSNCSSMPSKTMSRCFTSPKTADRKNNAACIRHSTASTA